MLFGDKDLYRQFAVFTFRKGNQLVFLGLILNKHKIACAQNNIDQPVFFMSFKYNGYFILQTGALIVTSVEINPFNKSIFSDDS